MKHFRLILLTALVLVFAASANAQETKPASKKAKKEHIADANVEKTQCKAITKKGTQCTRKAMAGSDYCKQHASAMSKSVKTDKKS